MMNGHRQSDGRIVPEKSSNKPEPTGAEGMEGRRPVKGNGFQSPVPRTLSRTEGMEAAMERIRVAVRRNKEEKLTSLYHHVYNVEHLQEAYFRLKREAAPGVDGKTWQEYGQNLEQNLRDLSGRLARGAYKPLPVRRVYIPKPDGRQRPLGVPALEDKIVQWVVARMLSVIWEEEFLGFSFGFRPGRNPHHALDALSVGIERERVNGVLDADIRGFYDSISHEWLGKFVEHRIGDRRVVQLIRKWMRAGVLEDGSWRRSEEGTPQGGLVSPVLANIYLHYAFDLWAQRWQKWVARGAVVIVRYADDFVVGFEHREDAERFQGELTDRLRKFELELHADKTRLIEFGRNASQRREARGEGKPETFDFLGFTHVCGRTRKGGFTVLRQTMHKRMRAKLKAIKQELRLRLHARIPDVGGWLRMVLEGHFRYYGVPMNLQALSNFRNQVVWLWKRAMGRRSQKGHVTWERMKRLVSTWLPNPRIYHPWPSQRLVVGT
jgi:group II intron reverse transcriptase/maturase